MDELKMFDIVYSDFSDNKVGSEQSGIHPWMKGVMSFSKDKHERFCRCPKCFGETKHRKLRDDDLDFGEVLGKEIYKRK